MSQIRTHEGAKYLRRVRCLSKPGASATVDVYEVMRAYRVTCQARGQAIKKLLCAGTRGKGDVLADLKGALAAVSRAIELVEADTLDTEDGQ